MRGGEGGWEIILERWGWDGSVEERWTTDIDPQPQPYPQTLIHTSHSHTSTRTHPHFALEDPHSTLFGMTLIVTERFVSG